MNTASFRSIRLCSDWSFGGSSAYVEFPVVAVRGYRVEGNRAASFPKQKLHSLKEP